jgi:hypothetical protein
VALRRFEDATHLVHAGRTVTLQQATWYLTAGYGRKLGGLSYRKPVSIRIDGRRPVRILDHVMIIRALAGIVMAAFILRTAVRGKTVR